MSTVRSGGKEDGQPFDGVKVVPHQRHLNVTELLADWAGEDPIRWRFLMVLALAEVAEWKLRWIGYALGLTEARISQLRCEAIEAVREPLAAAGCDGARQPDPRRDLSGAA